MLRAQYRALHIVLVQQDAQVLAALQLEHERLVPLGRRAAADQLRLRLAEVVPVRVDLDAHEQIARLIEPAQALDGEVQVADQQALVARVSHQVGPHLGLNQRLAGRYPRVQIVDLYRDVPGQVAGLLRQKGDTQCINFFCICFLLFQTPELSESVSDS